MRVSAVRHLAAARGADNGGSARVLRDLSITQCDAGQSAVVPGRDTRDRRTSPLQPRPQRACRQPAYRDHRSARTGIAVMTDLMADFLTGYVVPAGASLVGDPGLKASQPGCC